MKFERFFLKKNDYSTGHDKPVVDDVTSPLVHIINTRIDNRVLPLSWKIVHVCPVPKVDHTEDVTEFRPI